MRNKVTPAHKISHDEAMDAYRVEEQIGFIMRKAHQRASLIFEEVMGSFKITPQQFTTLIKLQDEREVSQNELGRLVAMDPATTFGVVGRLKQRGLIAQRTDPHDGRRILLSLTAAGQRKASEMRSIALQVSQKTLKPLKSTEAKRLLALLDKIS